MSLPALLRAPWRASLAPAADTSGEAGAAICPGCGAAVSRRFCGECGESPAADDLSLGALVGAGIAQLTALGVLVGAWYLWAALRRAYGSSWWGAALRTAALLVGMVFGAALYEGALFRITVELM